MIMFNDIRYNFKFLGFALILYIICGSRGGGGGAQGVGTPPPLENHKAIGFLINTGLVPMENHKATKTAFNVWPPWTRQQNAI